MSTLTRTALLLSSAATLTIGMLSPALAQDWVPSKPLYKSTPYVAGDMHNHTTCNDGSVSLPFLLDKSMSTFNIDWFTHGNHGGVTARDCRIATSPTDPNAGSSLDATVNRNYISTLGTAVNGITIDALKGDGKAGTGAMYRWQSIREIDYPLVARKSQQFKKVAIEGLEQIVPGHEHADVSVITGEFPSGATGSADKMAEYEFRFDRADGDTLGPVDGANAPLWPGKSFMNSGTAGHAKTVQGVQWLQANYPLTSYMIPTHSERAGAFNPAGSAGYNIEHFRDFNNAGPTVAVGIEAPGHAADPSHSYGAGALGGGTYGGDGIYTAKIGGLWDGLLGEGRNSFVFLSSDWHQRGMFASNDRYSTADFFPGEYSKLYVPNQKAFRAQSVVDGMRSGNSYSVAGNLIGNDLLFRACDAGVCKGMGETLVVNPGDTITVEVTASVPGTSNSPYSFPNPLLKQVGVFTPIDKPALDHVDLITGSVTGVVDPSSPNYAVPNTAATVYNPTTAIAATFGGSMLQTTTVNGVTRKSFTYTMTAPATPMYIRGRGTNMPASVPFVTDSAGSPLIDTGIVNVVCDDPACPAHLPVVDGTKRVKVDVEAWSNLWFHTNPIFIRPASVAPLLVEKNATLAQTLASAK